MGCRYLLSLLRSTSGLFFGFEPEQACVKRLLLAVCATTRLPEKGQLYIQAHASAFHIESQKLVGRDL